MKIIGNTVGTTTPKPNLRQSDPKKGDYIFGSDELIKSINNIVPDENGNVEINVSENAVCYTPQDLTEEQKEQARENIGFTDIEAVTLAAEMGLIDPVTDENGAIFIDENGAILTL